MPSDVPVVRYNMGKLPYILMTMDHDGHRQLQVRVVWDYDPHTMPTFHKGYLWPKHYTSGMTMGNGHCRGRMVEPQIYKGSIRGILGNISWTYKTEHNWNNGSILELTGLKNMQQTLKWEHIQISKGTRGPSPPCSNSDHQSGDRSLIHHYIFFIFFFLFSSAWGSNVPSKTLIQFYIVSLTGSNFA